MMMSYLLLLVFKFSFLADSYKAFFVFGDSSVDPGNNNYIKTVPEKQANYKPYGLNGFFKDPTGRFSNGRIIVDFIAEYAKLSIIPPYLEPSADYSYGVNFASGGAGVLSTTKQGLGLYKKGARKFGFLSLSPLGCLPVMRALNPKEDQGCFEQANALAMAHNKALKDVLRNLEHLLEDFKYCNSDFYHWLQDRMSNPSNHGFKEGVNACCGTGPYGGVYTCGGTKKVATYQLCENVNDYVWWDSYHPTERIHEQFAKALWGGPSTSIAPYSLQDLFLDEDKLSIVDVVDNNLVYEQTTVV